MQDSDLQRAIALSKQSFQKEEELRRQARELEAQLQRQSQWSHQKCYNTLLHSMKWQPLFVNRGVGSGLQNLGNSCFMNATLQCLAYTAPFAQLLCQSNHSAHATTSKFNVLCELERVIPALLMNKQTISPRNLFTNIPKINDLLTPGCQEDAHEFLQSLLDKLELAYDDISKQKRSLSNPIRQLFTGATKTCIQCARCKTKSITEEPFCCISLEVDDNVGLSEAMEIYTQDELMRGADKYFCDVCQRKCVAHKRLTLSKIPPIFIMHFKRFCYQLAASHHRQGVAKKLADHIEFPTVLNLKNIEHCIFESDRQQVLLDPEYELYAVLVHSGPQLGYGHYYALIKASDGYWYRMNDTQVMPVSIKHVLREQGYLVFYKRKTDTLMQLEEHNMNEEEKEDNVKIGMVNDSYFEKKCVIVEDIGKEKGHRMDRNEYVHVPPMDIRPAPVMDRKYQDNEPEEIFWAPKDSLDE